MHYDFSIGPYRVEECATCGLMRLNPQPTDEDLARIYSSSYFAFSGDSDGQLHAAGLKSSTADQYLDLIEAYAGSALSGSLLEVGCGHGDFLARAAARGLTVTGVELSAHAAQVAAGRAGPRSRVIAGDIKDVIARGEKFDCIVFADVLEHVRDPREFLRDVHSLLNDEAIVAIVVPALDSTSARLLKTKWFEFKAEHLWYFSSETLPRLLYTEGFGALRVAPARKTLSFDYIAEHFDRYPVQPFAWMVRLARRSVPRFLRRFPFQLTASGIVVVGRKAPKRARKLLSVIMPVFNEAKSVRAGVERVLAKQIPGVDIELIIVESRSTDGTREIVREFEGRERVSVIWEDRPRGKGHAVRAGLNQMLGDFILIQDADDEYDIEDYDALLEPLISGEAAFVLGARHGGRSWKMRQFNDQRLMSNFLNLGHWGFTTLVNLLYGLRLKDPFTMYKVFRADCLRGLDFECNRFDFDCELLIKLVKQGFRPIEIPVNYRSRSFKEGKKVDVMRDPWTWLRAIVKFRFQKN
ncbi:MAG TPA: glycosyltransferase [Burkholderiaceae bacterium]|nr:glycosyltransferase [Burkholderiaceae bacterium]